MNIFKKIFFLAALLSASACSSIFDEGVTVESDEGTMIYDLKLIVPGQKSSTRAVDIDDESTVSMDKLQVLVFDADDKFVYDAPVKYVKKYNGYASDGWDAEYETYAQLRFSEQKEKYSLVILANCDRISPAAGATKSEVSDMATYNAFRVSNRLGTGSGGNGPNAGTAFPMWGKTDLKAITKKTKFDSVIMYRAMARVDIGLNFKQEDGKIPYYPDPEIEGIVKKGCYYPVLIGIDSIWVFNSHSKGYVAPKDGILSGIHILDSEEKGENVNMYPDGVTFNPDTVIYHAVSGMIAGAALPGQMSVRQIYIPEFSNFNSDGSLKNSKDRCFIVLKLTNAMNIPTRPVSVDDQNFADTLNGYFRLDFKDGEFHNVMRNTRYVFNIQDVTGPGYPSLELAALNGPSTETVQVVDRNGNPVYVANDSIQGSKSNIMPPYLKVNATRDWLHYLEYSFYNDRDLLEIEDTSIVIDSADGVEKLFIFSSTAIDTVNMNIFRDVNIEKEADCPDEFEVAALYDGSMLYNGSIIGRLYFVSYGTGTLPATGWGHVKITFGDITIRVRVRQEDQSSSSTTEDTSLEPGEVWDENWKDANNGDLTDINADEQ